MFRIPLLALLVSATLAPAAEVVTLDWQNPEVTVNPTDTVQILGAIKGTQARQLILGRYRLGKRLRLNIPAGDGELMQLPLTMSGLEVVRLQELVVQDNVAVSLRISRAGDEVHSEPIVMPAATDGSFRVAVETSTDLVNWTPGATGDYLASSTHRYFRLNVKKLGAE